MYTFIPKGDCAEFWFNDVDEWEVMRNSGKRIDDEMFGDAYIVDYADVVDPGMDIPSEGRYLLLVLKVTDMARVEQIAQEEWCYYEASLSEVQA